MTYDANGFYGHPDHIQAHRVAWRAFERAGAGGPVKFYATAAPESGQVTTEVDASAYLERKLAAMRAHATQITVVGPVLRLVRQRQARCAGGGVLHSAGRPPGPARGPRRRETDLLAQ